MATLSETLSPSQRRAIQDVQELCRRAAPHLDRLRIGGAPQEQDEERLAHLLRCCEGIMAYEHNLVNSLGNANDRTRAGDTADA
jgi:hypothetical protein